MRELHERYGERANFLTVYIKEAHPEDEWQMSSNVEDDVCYPQPRTLEERLRIASDFVQRFDYRLPLVVDTMQNDAERAYSGWPERLYVIDETGHIAYKGGLGPFGFEPDEVAAWLESAGGQ